MRLRAWFRRKGQFEEEMGEELRFHLERQIAANIAAGMAPEEAWRQARLQLGAVEGVKAECREERRGFWLESVWSDIRYGLRMLRNSPGFTTVAVLTLALGIGANTAIFSVVYAVLLKPLPFKDANQLVLLTESNPRKVDSAGVPFPDYVAWKNQSTVFEETAAYWDTGAVNDMVLGGLDSAERVQYSVVTNSFFSILGVQPRIGRVFAQSDEKAGAARVFLASNALWQGVFGGRRDAIGRSFLLDGESYALAGVMPSGFDYPQGCDVWLPVGVLGERGMSDRISHPFRILGRLKRGASVRAAEVQINGIQAQLARAYPKTDADWRVLARPLLDTVVGSVRPALLVLLAAVGFILLIACANAINLMLARATARKREFALRATLGARRGRLIRQTLLESLLIVAISSVIALAFAAVGIRVLAAINAGRVPRLERFHLNGPVLAFTAAIAVLTTVLVGMAPALQLSSAHAPESLAEGPRSGTTTGRGQRLRGALVISEVALTIALLCGAGLMLKSLFELSRVNPGFRPENVVIMRIALPGAQYPQGAQTTVFLNRLLEKLKVLPGVQSAAAANFVPFSGQSDWGSFYIMGRASPSAAQDWAQAASAEGRSVSPGYFRTMGIPLLRGREFTEEDQRAHAPVMVINETMARKFWPGADPIGERVVNMHERPPGREIVGIVGDVKSFGLDVESPPEMYTPYGGWWYTNVVLRSSLPAATLATGVRGAVASLDKGVAVYGVSTMENLLARSGAPQRFNVFLLGLFGALALTLATVGIFGVLAFSVSRRAHEIGIRMALGAQRRQILSLVVWQGMRLVLVGTVLGLVAAGVLTRFMRTLLFGVGATDPFTFACVSVLLAGAALLACWIPARRAMRVDPMRALRHE